ncbi:hypothetical protein F4560_003052 [Saccharothrix ecbatanensis]|uniref:Lantibiotic dehydratase N-terminal domain-containing protein n=1 Tax=Saccharothrix ecbatanensis TaxID=1105145 RepID=A0A7W9HJ69_9PSEU|nr:lantibiotic dehydratase [Saccharothrix ecbatanensis]MBB5803284.1 hypothetical protein [Saccharothrix ecbatanensis]
MAPPPAHPGPSTADFVIGGVFGVRVGGVPVADLDALRCERAWAAAEQVVGLTRWLRAEGTALSDLLRPEIGRCADEGRPLLVALRRAVFQGKRPNGRVWTVRHVLSHDTRARVEYWARELARAGELTGRVPALLAEEHAAVREALRVAAGRDAFRLGLVLGSPDLTRSVARWLDDPRAPAPRAGALASLARYLARAAVKPSPYASFTLSGLGGWTDGGPAVATSGDLHWRGVPELDRMVVLALWSALAEHPDTRDHVRLRTNPAVEDVGERLWFPAATPGEPIVCVAATDAVRAVLELVRTEPESTLGSLAGTPPAEPVRAFVAELVAVGLLERCRPFSDQSATPLDQLARWVDEHVTGSPWPPRLRELWAAVDGYRALVTAAERRERLHLVRDLLDGLLTDLGRTPWPPNRPVLLENAVLPRPAVVCSRERWRPVLEDLAAVRGFLGILDRSLPLKLRLAEFFRSRFGSRELVPFPRLYREYRADGGDGSQALADLWRAVASELYDGDAGVGDTVSVDPRVLAKLAASWPAHVRAPQSVCCYGQELPGEDGPRLVLNTVRTGYGWGITRIEHLLTAAGGTVPARTPVPAGPDMIFAECRAAFGSQLNQRAPAVSHAIDYPGGQPPDGRAERLSLNDLWVRQDPVRGRLLLCDRRGRQVRPLALGMLVEHALPPALRFLVAVFGEPQTAFAPYPQLDGVGWRPAVDGVQHRPRLEVGRVVLARAGWRVPAAAMPTRAKGQSDADFLLELARWRDRHTIPRRCFVRVPGRRSDPTRKPIYLDFSNWFLLSALPRPDTAAVLEEALPAPADAPHHGVHGQRVTEYVFELSATDPHG